MGDRIRELRLARGMTQAELAAAAGVQLDTLRKWERGLRTPLLDAAALLADGLDCSLDELAGRAWKPRGRRK